MHTSEILTLLIATGGLLLGVRAEWREHRRTKATLRVIPKVAYPVGPMPDSRPRLAFEIINDGQIAVTVTEVGLFYQGTTSRGALTPILPGAAVWPHRLEPHSSIVAYTSPEALMDPMLRKAACAYVLTATDKIFEGTSPALRFVVNTGTIPAPPSSISRTGATGFVSITAFDE